MDAIRQLMYDVRRNNLDVGMSYMVYVTYVNNPHSFYVRPRDYNWYLSAVHARGNRMTKSEATLGAIAIFRSEILKDFARGRIVFIHGDENTLFNLYAIDDGFLEKEVPLRNIWKPYHSSNLPPLAFHCQLGKCVPKAGIWENSTIEAMRAFVKGKLANIVIKNILPDVVVVELSVACPDDLATLLALTRHSSHSFDEELEEEQSKLMYWAMSCQFYRARGLKVKDIIHVRMQSGSFLDKFFVAPVDEYEVFLRHRDNYTSYAHTIRTIDDDLLKLNVPVGIFHIYTNKYERGIIRELFQNINKAKVELVDWGKAIEESFEVMKPIPFQYMQHLPVAIYCSLHVNQYSIMSLTEISDLPNISYPGVEFMISIEELGDEESPNLVTVYDINE